LAPETKFLDPPLFDSKLKFQEYVWSNINKVYSMLIRIHKTSKIQEALIYLFKTLAEPRLENAEAVWSPHRVMYIKGIKTVQIRTTKLV
jgi:hypothetical protein